MNNNGLFKFYTEACTVSNPISYPVSLLSQSLPAAPTTTTTTITTTLFDKRQDSKEKQSIWTRAFASCAMFAFGSSFSFLRPALQFIDTPCQDQQQNQLYNSMRQAGAVINKINDYPENLQAVTNPENASNSTQTSSSSVTKPKPLPSLPLSARQSNPETIENVVVGFDRQNHKKKSRHDPNNVSKSNNENTKEFTFHNNPSLSLSPRNVQIQNLHSPTPLIDPSLSDSTSSSDDQKLYTTIIQDKVNVTKQNYPLDKKNDMQVVEQSETSYQTTLTPQTKDFPIQKLPSNLKITDNISAYSKSIHSISTDYLPNSIQLHSSHNHDPDSTKTYSPPVKNHDNHPENMRAPKFDESKLKKRRPITTCQYKNYSTDPQIELPEDPVDTDLYSQAYLKIIEARDHKHAKFGKQSQEILNNELEKLVISENPSTKQTETIKVLNKAELQKVQNAWKVSNPQECIADSFRVQVTTRDIQTLRHGAWLNDTVIDFYLALITNRSQQDKSLPRTFAFTSHFYPKLEKEGFEGVKRWAARKKIDVTQMDYIYIPVNRNNTHWCLAVINNKDARFEFYDSMNGRGKHTLSNLRDYMISQTMMTYPESDPKELGYGSYEMLTSVPCPQQENAADCGVFTCKMVEVLSREQPLLFTQQDMPNLRMQMTLEILSRKLCL